ncbi:MAG: Gfo/Idh/MocA family oxidoreductase [Chloroflexi bacterium]|nr:Gfo/Idh/MocA family oxidoreductase [Chloroflexota bacterium]
MTRLALVGHGPDDESYVRIAPRAGAAGIAAVTDGAQGDSHNVVAAAMLAELLDVHSDAIDAVIIQTPTDERASHIEAAVTAGKHVLVSGPLGRSASEARETAKACAGANVVLMAGQIDRYRPDVGAVRASMDAGQMGRPGLVRSHRWQPPTDGPTAWRLDPNRSGGIFIHELTRDIDVAAWLFDAPPNTVFAVARGADPDRPDAAVVHLGFPDGGMAVLDVTTGLPEGEGYWSLQLIGADGAVYADDQHNMQLLYAGGSPAARLTSTGDATVLAQLEAFVDAIDNGLDPAASIEDAVLALEVAEAAMASAASGRAATRTEDGYVLV